MQLDHFPIFARVLPEDRFQLVKALQKAGYIVGMCGDGANDAPALRQAQMGIAVSTDVAKSAAGIVLTEPGLGGIVASVKAAPELRLTRFYDRVAGRKLDTFYSFVIAHEIPFA